MEVAVQQLVAGLTVGSVYALVALGYSLVYSTLRVVNFTQGHLVMLSALITVTLWDVMGWPLAAAIVTATLIMAGFGFLLERGMGLVSRGGASPVAWIIGTLAVAVVLQEMAGLEFFFGKDARPFPPLIHGDPVQLGGAAIARDSFVVVGAALVIMLIIDRFLKHTIWGKAIQATAYSPWVPRLVGVPVPRVVTLSFVLAGAIAGLSGALIGPIYKDAATNIGLPLGLYGFIAVVVGGMGSTSGALVGGLLLGVVQQVLRGQLPVGIGSGAVFLFLILLLVVRPSGLFGREWGTESGTEAFA